MEHILEVNKWNVKWFLADVPKATNPICSKSNGE